MRIRNVLLASLLAAAPALAQEKPAANQPPKPSQPAKPAEKPKADPDSLEAVIADAMKNNPDIRAAEAKVREAEANLNKVRSEVMVQVAGSSEVVRHARDYVKSLEQTHNVKLQARAKGSISDSEVWASQAELQKSRGELAKQEAEYHKLIGRVPGVNLPGMGAVVDPNWSTPATVDWNTARFTTTNPNWQSDARFLFDYTNKGTFTPLPMTNVTYNPVASTSSAASNSNMMDKIRAALDKPVKIMANGEVPLQSLPGELGTGADIPFRFFLRNGADKVMVSLSKGELPLGAWLVAVQDEHPDIVFLAREYGILVTARDRAPKDAIPIADFWRRAAKPAEKPKEEKK